MTTFDQIQHGIVKYIDGVVLPHMSGVQRLAAAAYMGLAAQNIAPMLHQYKDHPAVKVLDVIHDDMVDLDKLHAAIMPYFKERVTIDIPILGRFIFDSNDVDNMFAYMRG